MVAQTFSMSSMRAFVTAFSLLAFPSLALALDIAGSYRLEGANPGEAGRYTGTAEVSRTGDTFQVIWRIGGQVQQGTGILLNDVFSITYQQDGALPGIAVYEVGQDGVLSGTWAPVGSPSVGIEVWTPQGT